MWSELELDLICKALSVVDCFEKLKRLPAYLGALLSVFLRFALGHEVIVILTFLFAPLLTLFEDSFYGVTPFFSLIAVHDPNNFLASLFVKQISIVFELKVVILNDKFVETILKLI